MTFPWPAIGNHIEDPPTPMPIIDEDELTANIIRVQTHIE